MSSKGVTSFIDHVQKLVTRWPLLLFVCVILAVELALYGLLRIVYKCWEKITMLCVKTRKIRNRTRYARNFADWLALAKELDRLEGHEAWKAETQSKHYDFELIEDLIAKMQSLREQSDMQELLKLLSSVYSTPNIGGINNEELYSKCHVGTKVLVEEFVEEVCMCTQLLRDAPAVPLEEKLAVFRLACKNYGKTGLLLSGGAAMGYFHLGVIKALFETKQLPYLLSGASAGSLIAVFLGVRTNAEIREVMKEGAGMHKYFTPADESIWTKVSRVLRKGYLFDVNYWIPKLREMTLGDLTFMEAYRKTGRVVNVTITSTSTHSDNLVCSYRTTPHVVMWSAILASSAMPQVIKPVVLLEKRPDNKNKDELTPFQYGGKAWKDGTIKSDIPTKQLTKIHNAHFFLVCQVNPHATPFFFNARGAGGVPTSKRGNEHYRGGFLMALMEKFLKLEMKKWLMLIGELDLLPVMFGTSWRYLFTQDLTGSITIVPRVNLSHYINLLTDPNLERMEDYLWRGEKATWPVLSRYRTRYLMEQTVNRCYSHLLARANAEMNSGSETEMGLPRAASLMSRDSEYSLRGTPTMPSVADTKTHAHAHAVNSNQHTKPVQRGKSKKNKQRHGMNEQEKNISFDNEKRVFERSPQKKQGRIDSPSALA